MPCPRISRRDALPTLCAGEDRLPTPRTRPGSQYSQHVRMLLSRTGLIRAHRFPPDLRGGKSNAGEVVRGAAPPRSPSLLSDLGNPARRPSHPPSYGRGCTKAGRPVALLAGRLSRCLHVHTGVTTYCTCPIHSISHTRPCLRRLPRQLEMRSCRGLYYTQVKSRSRGRVGNARAGDGSLCDRGLWRRGQCDTR